MDVTVILYCNHVCVLIQVGSPRAFGAHDGNNGGYGMMFPGGGNINGSAINMPLASPVNADFYGRPQTGKAAAYRSS